MVGHGFNSEVAQNKNMAASFDNHFLNESPKSERSPQTSSSANYQSNSADIPIGKKVICLFEYIFY